MAIKHCDGDCRHEFQDKLYGKSMRVFNQTVKGHRCTVCDKEKLGGGTGKKK